MNRIKIISILSIVIVSIITITTISCQKSSVKDVNHSSSTINQQSRDIDFEDKYDLMIQTVAYGLLDLSNNSNFRALVNSEVELQFDGDDNVLLKKLNETCAEQGINLTESMKESLENHGKHELVQFIAEAIDGFEYFDTKLYPQVFIPFIENKNLQQLPKISLNYEDDEILESVKYSNGSVEQSNVNEDEAKASLVWVISMNESVNAEGEIPSNENSTGNKKSRGVNRVLNVYKIKVTDKKEGWGNGRADISFVAVQIKPSGCIKQERQSQPMMKVNDADIYGGGNWLYPASTSCLSCGPHSLTDGGNVPIDLWEEDGNEQIPILFYELDVRNKFEKSEQLWGACSNTVRKYISKESKYGNTLPVKTDFPNYSASYKNYGGMSGMEAELKGQKY